MADRLSNFMGDIRQEFAAAGSSKNEFLVLGLRVLAVTELLVGIFVFFYLIKTFSTLETSLRQGGVTVGQFVIAFSVVLYHVVVGFSCLGIGEILAGDPPSDEEDEEDEVTNSDFH